MTTDRRIAREELSLYTHSFKGMGLVATDGVQRTGVVTFGTVSATLINELIDIGQHWWTRYVKVGLTQRFTEIASANASLSYYWQARSEYNIPSPCGIVATITGWVNFTGTYTKGIAAKANAEDTFSGNIDVGSLPGFPIRMQLLAAGLVNNTMTSELKNSSFVEVLGTVIPGAG